MAPAAMELHSRRERQVFADCSRRSAVVCQRSGRRVRHIVLVRARHLLEHRPTGDGRRRRPQPTTSSHATRNCATHSNGFALPRTCDCARPRRSSSSRLPPSKGGASSCARRSSSRESTRRFISLRGSTCRRSPALRVMAARCRRSSRHIMRRSDRRRSAVCWPVCRCWLRVRRSLPRIRLHDPIPIRVCVCVTLPQRRDVRGAAAPGAATADPAAAAGGGRRRCEKK